MDRREWLMATGAAAGTGAGALLTACVAQGQSAAPGKPAGLGSKADFPLAATRTYLNNAAVHPISVQAAHAARDYLVRRSEGGQPPDYDVSPRVKQAFAALINGDPAGVSYVTSTIVGENLVVAGLGIPQGSGNVVTDALHFEGSLYLYGSLAQRGVDVRIVEAESLAHRPRGCGAGDRRADQARGGLAGLFSQRL